MHRIPSPFLLLVVILVLMFTIGCSAPPTLTTIPTAVRTSVPPTVAPTIALTATATKAPTIAPTTAPTIAPTAIPTVAPTKAPTTAPTVMPTAAAASSTSSGRSINPLDAFPPGPGRALLIPSCDTCHSYMCGLFHKLTVDHWRTVRANHGTRIGSLNAADFNTVFEYLMLNFNDTKPEPNVPPEIKQGVNCIERG